MGRTRFGQSAPWCPKCEKHTLPLKAKFGTPCPECACPTVWYHEYIQMQDRITLERIRREFPQESPDGK